MAVRRYPYPGKFEGEKIYAPFLYQFAGYGSGDDFVGSVAEIGWCATLLKAPLVDENEVKRWNEENPDLELNEEEIQHLQNLAGVIIVEDDLGFAHFHEYTDHDTLMRDWDEYMMDAERAFNEIEDGE